MIAIAPEDCFRHSLSRELQRVQKLKCTVENSFVANLDWNRFLALSNQVPNLAIVADNPGNIECATSVYLSAAGSAGKAGRRFLDLAFGCDVIRSGRVIIFNRSSYHTRKTADLRRLISERRATPEVLDAIHNDQQANGRLVGAIAMTLGIPVLALGGDQRSDTFSAFRQAFCEEVAHHTPSEPIVLLNKPLACRIHSAPHFSRSAAFKKGSNREWNSRLESFLKSYPWAATEKGNVSWKAVGKHAIRHGVVTAARDYLLDVMLGGTRDSA